MKELTKNRVYYRKHKDKYKKGGKYYTYKPKDTSISGDIKIERGVFIVSFS